MAGHIISRAFNFCALLTLYCEALYKSTIDIHLGTYMTDAIVIL